MPADTAPSPTASAPIEHNNRIAIPQIYYIVLKGMERDNEGRANVLLRKGNVFFERDSLREAMEVYEKALFLYICEKDNTGYVFTMSELCLVYSLRNEQEKAIKMIAQLNEAVKQIPYEPVRNYAAHRVLQAQDILKNSVSVGPVTDNDSENASSEI